MLISHAIMQRQGERQLNLCHCQGPSESDPINPSTALAPLAEQAPALPSQSQQHSHRPPVQFRILSSAALLINTTPRPFNSRTVVSLRTMLRPCTGSSQSHHQSVAAAAPGTMASPTAFSLFFPLPNKGQWSPADEAGAFDDDRSSITTSPSSPSSSSSAGSVDCTLSLGTPSSRRAAADPVEQAKRAAAQPAYSSASAAPWDVAADQSYYYCFHGSKPAAAGAAKGAVARAEHDALLADRHCANCGTSSTPLWRNGPRGPKVNMLP